MMRLKINNFNFNEPCYMFWTTSEIFNFFFSVVWLRWPVLNLRHILVWTLGSTLHVTEVPLSFHLWSVPRDEKQFVAKTKKNDSCFYIFTASETSGYRRPNADDRINRFPLVLILNIMTKIHFTIRLKICNETFFDYLKQHTDLKDMILVLLYKIT